MDFLTGFGLRTRLLSDRRRAVSRALTPRAAACNAKSMSTVAEIEAVVPSLTVEELTALEQFIHRLRESKAREVAGETARPFITRTRDFGFKPGVDLTKLGQLADEL
jgi:hypothetical protein